MKIMNTDKFVNDYPIVSASVGILQSFRKLNLRRLAHGKLNGFALKLHRLRSLRQRLRGNEQFLSCPVCGDPYLLYLRNTPTRRTKRHIPLFVCLSCRSFSNPSGYREDEDQLRRGLELHLSVEERNTAALRLLKILTREGVDCSRIVEIGAGIGTFLNAAGKLGYQGIGYEVNALTQGTALSKFGVGVRTEFWTKDTDTGPFTLLACISVLEHIDQPRDLLKNICEACVKQDAACFISVPFVEREQWHFITCDDPKEPGTPFFDNDVHVTHFLERDWRVYSLNLASSNKIG